MLQHGIALLLDVDELFHVLLHVDCCILEWCGPLLLDRVAGIGHEPPELLLIQGHADLLLHHLPHVIGVVFTIAFELQVAHDAIARELLAGRLHCLNRSPAVSDWTVHSDA